MKKALIMLLCLLAALCLAVPALGANQSYGVWQGRYCYYDPPSIGRENEKGLRGVAQAPSMNLAAGIYATAVQVRLMGEGEIYYTTDGSAPSRASTRYQGEVLTISQPTAVRAIAYQADCLPSAITTAQSAAADGGGQAGGAVWPLWYLH